MILSEDSQPEPLFLTSVSIAPRTAAPRPAVPFGVVVSVADVLVLTVSFALAYVIRSRINRYGVLLPLSGHLWLFAALILIWLVFASASGLTNARNYRTMSRPLLLTAKVQAIAALILLSGLYLLKAIDVSRLLIQIFLVISVVAMIAERAAFVRFVTRWDRAVRRLLVVGTNGTVGDFLRLVQDRPLWGRQIAGFVASGRVSKDALGHIPILGGVDDIGALLDTGAFDEVVMADANVAPKQNDHVVSACLERGLTYHTLARMPDILAARHQAEEVGDGLYLITLEAAQHDPAALLVKRAIDIAGACVGLVFCGLAFIVFAPLIRLGSPGPAIFKQTRVGRAGRHFTLYKFRTMGVDADAQKEALLASNEMRGHLFKLRDDPRVTPIGRFLRRTYLDECPQFWNVLRSDMSLVGTRPPTPEEVAQYSPHHRRRISVRPGITGLWQSMGNGKVWDFEVVVKLDCDYIDRWSIGLDLQILLRTVFVVVRGAGH
jgi:exopolysaccharide biosynthesis polyprenyl glycosylphosphotransferase